MELLPDAGQLRGVPPAALQGGGRDVVVHALLLRAVDQAVGRPGGRRPRHPVGRGGLRVQPLRAERRAAWATRLRRLRELRLGRHRQHVLGRGGAEHPRAVREGRQRGHRPHRRHQQRGRPQGGRRARVDQRGPRRPGVPPVAGGDVRARAVRREHLRGRRGRRRGRRGVPGVGVGRPDAPGVGRAAQERPRRPAAGVRGAGLHRGLPRRRGGGGVQDGAGARGRAGGLRARSRRRPGGRRRARALPRPAVGQLLHGDARAARVDAV